MHPLIRDEYSFRRGNWFDAVGDECRAVRTRVGVLDQTSFAKFMVSGPGAERFLDRALANRLPAEVGRMAELAVAGPLGEGELSDQRGLEPGGVALADALGKR